MESDNYVFNPGITPLIRNDADVEFKFRFECCSTSIGISVNDVCLIRYPKSVPTKNPLVYFELTPEANLPVGLDIYISFPSGRLEIDNVEFVVGVDPDVIDCPSYLKVCGSM